MHVILQYCKVPIKIKLIRTEGYDRLNLMELCSVVRLHLLPNQHIFAELITPGVTVQLDMPVLLNIRWLRVSNKPVCILLHGRVVTCPGQLLPLFLLWFHLA